MACAAQSHPDEHDAVLRLAPSVRIQRSAIRFEHARSSGPGGQNVNKRATKAVLRVSLNEIHAPPPVLKRLAALAGRRLNAAGEIVIEAEEHRSQQRNKDACLERLRLLALQAAARPKPRIATKPSRGSVQRRLDTKKQRGETKARRKRPDW